MNVDHYMALEYPIELRRIPDDEGGGYAAMIPQLGRLSAVGIGETRVEALGDLDGAKKAMFEYCLEKGLEIPAPVDDKVDELEGYSGKFLAKPGKEIHRKLAENAKRNGISLSMYHTMLLSRLLTLEEVNYSKEEVLMELKPVRPQIWEENEQDGDPSYAVAA